MEEHSAILKSLHLFFFHAERKRLDPVMDGKTSSEAAKLNLVLNIFPYPVSASSFAKHLIRQKRIKACPPETPHC